MVTIAILSIIGLAIVGWGVVQLVREQRQLAERARRRAFIQWQQRRAERQMRAITQAAFMALLDEAQQHPIGQAATQSSVRDVRDVTAE